MNQEKIKEARRLLCQYLRKTAKEKGLSTYKIAELTGFAQPNVHRMLSGKHPITLDNFIILCDVINAYIFIIDKNEDADIVTLMKDRWRRTGDQQ